MFYIAVYFYSEYYSGIRAHRLGSACGADQSMTPGGKEYITYRTKRSRSRERRLEATFGEGDCISVMDAEKEEPMAKERDDGKEFGNLLLKSVQELSRRIEEMGQKFAADNR